VSTDAIAAERRPGRPAGPAIGSSVRPPARPSVYDGLKQAVAHLQRWSNHHDRYRFENRAGGRTTLVLVLAGYKRPLWPYVFPRLSRGLPDGADVCVVSPGRDDSDLSELAARHGWSYLATRTNDVCLAQNIGLRLHPAAVLIVKMDEDMFVTARTVADCLAYYRHLEDGGIVRPGAVAPMINVNGVCTRHLLRRLDLLPAFEAAFGIAPVATTGTPATTDAAAARWLWSRTAPLEDTLAKLAGESEPSLMAPVQFSIGLVVFARSFWEAIGSFPVRRHQLLTGRTTLGADEEHFCRMAMAQARPVVICQHALAGHFAFGPQYAGMLDLLAEHPDYFT
jgi:hypothetical protein